MKPSLPAAADTEAPPAIILTVNPYAIRARMALFLVDNAGRLPLHRDSLLDGPFTAIDIAAHGDMAIKIALRTLLQSADRRAAHANPANMNKGAA